MDDIDLTCDEDAEFLDSGENTPPTNNATGIPENNDEHPQIQSHKMEDFSDLYCNEDPEFLNSGENENTSFIKNATGTSENEDEYIQFLIQRENSTTTTTATTSSSSSSSSSSNTEHLKTLRYNAIQWILSIREFFNFYFETAFLAITYLDRFLSKKPIQSDRIFAFKLLTVACLALAAKMEEMKVPRLMDFCTRGYEFEKGDILKMELMVLKTLEWRMGSITPFPYITYFLKKLSDDQSRFGVLVPTTINRALDIVTEINLMDQRSSTIAAAAVLGVLDKGLTRNSLEGKMNLLSSCGPLQNDNVFTCYRRLLELEMVVKAESPELEVSPDLSSNLSDLDCSEDPSFTSTSDHNSDTP